MARQQHVTVVLLAQDAEPILRTAAEEAAKFGAWCDHFTRRTGHQPSWGGMSFEDRRKEWLAKFLKAKRMVEAFGVDYEPTSEEETLTVDYPSVGGKRKVVDLGSGIGKVGWITGSQPDFKHPFPSYRGGVHAEACRQAANRVVRRWLDHC